MVQDFPADARSVDEIPDSYRPRLIGTRSEIIERLTARFAKLDFSDPAWGVLEGEGFSMELNIGESEEVDGMMLHVYGAGEVMSVVQGILDCLGVRAIDISSGEFLSPSSHAH